MFGAVLLKRKGASPSAGEKPAEPTAAALESVPPPTAVPAASVPVGTAAALAATSPASTFEAPAALPTVRAPATAAAPARRTPRAKPLPTPPSSAAAVAARPSPSATAQSATPTPRTDLVVASRRLVKVNVSPSQARVFLDGRYIGISDDWDDAGGGTLLSFPFEGNHRLRMAYPGFRDLNVEVQIRRNATEDKVEIERDLEKGAPEGPLGPQGKFRRPHYRTVRGAVFALDPPDALVNVDGKDLGPASTWATEELVLDAPGVHEVTLSAPDREPVTIRLLVANTAGEFQAKIKEKLKKLN